MSFLKDKTYENMDWLSQAVEPYHCEINDVLAELPDEYVVPFNAIKREIANSWSGSVHIRNVVRVMFETFYRNKVNNLDYSEKDLLHECFKLEATPFIKIIPSQNIMEGSIKLVKKIKIIEDAAVKKLMKKASYLNMNQTDCNASAIVDLGALFFEDPSEQAIFLKHNKKHRYYAIAQYIAEAADKDIFKIRSLSAYKIFIKIVSEYLVSGDPQKLGEIFKVIMMAKNDQPIYNIGGSNGKNS